MATLADKFISAVEAGQVAEVKSVFDKDVDGVIKINERFPSGRTALQTAIWGGKEDVALLLIDRGANVNAPPATASGETALQTAARGSKFSLIQLLLENGANVNAEPGENGTLTAIQLAAGHGNLTAIAYLAYHGADINAPHIRGGKTALLAALGEGDRDAVELLLSLGADIDAVANSRGETAASYSEQINSEASKLVKRQRDRVRRRLVVCCDGTWQRNDTQQPLTNVARIARCLSELDHRNEKSFTQIVHYQPGVGTSNVWLYDVYEGLYATTLDAEIREAYGFICDNLSDPTDEIILIGFSRGAFAVRALAALVNDIGVLRGIGRYCLQRLYDLWEKQSPDLDGFACHLYINGLLRKHVPIKVCATWDTVASLGAKIPKWLPQIQSRKLDFVDSTLSRNIQNAFQALALDEKRFHFQPKVWANHNQSAQTLTQCWFRGSHSDIGGGTKNLGLANLSLAWMIGQLTQFLSFEELKISHLATQWTRLREILEGNNSDVSGQSFRVFDSMTWLYRAVGTAVRRPNEAGASGNFVHFSVSVLGNQDPAIAIPNVTLQDIPVYLPAQESVEHRILREWARAKDVEDIRSTLEGIVVRIEGQDGNIRN